MDGEKSAETVPVFTINHFPAEVIEKFAPDLRPSTVSTLRLVSGRFHDVFTADRFYRRYLWYADRPGLYRADLEEIGDAPDRWRRCLEAEKRRLDNWRRGRPTRVETLRVPSDSERRYFSWQVEMGEGNDYWVICELGNRKLLLANVTGEPIVTVVDVSCHTSKSGVFARLFADQVMIDGGDGSRRVFNISNDGRKLSLEYLFTIKGSNEDGVHISGKSNATQTYRSLYIMPNDSGVLAVWDLKRAVQLDNIDVNEQLPPHLAVEEQAFFWREPRTEFPHVLLTLSGRNDAARERWYAFVAVDVDERRVAACCFIDKDDLFDYTLELQGGTLLIQKYFDASYEYDMCTDKYEMWTCDLRERRAEPRLLLHIPRIQNFVSDPPLVVNQVDCNTIFYIRVYDSEMLWSEVDTRLFRTGVFSVVGPFLLAFQNRSELDNNQMVTLSLTGELLFDWDEMLSENGVIRNFDNGIAYSTTFCGLSKCIVKNEAGDELYICHF